MGWELNKVLVSFESLLAEINPRVLNVDNIDVIDEQHIGATLWFDGKFRTRNSPGPNYLEEGFSLTGDTEADPMIYRNFTNFNLVMSIDPKWITTSTAFCSFRPSGGIASHAGLCIVKDVNTETRTVFATPLVIGLPRSPLMEAMFGRG